MNESNESKLNKVRSAGLYTKGFVYVLIGALTAMAALGLGGDVQGRSGIQDFLEEQPFGIVLVAAAALGLLCYSLWRIYQGTAGAVDGGDKKKIAKRARYIYSGLLYLFIAFSFGKPVISLIFNGSSSDSGGGSRKAALAELLDKDWGPWVIGGIALVVLAMAAFQVYRGISKKYMDKIENHQGNERTYEIVKQLGRMGYIARGIVFGILAFFLYKVMSAHSADEYQGTEGALNWLLQQNYGKWLMGAVALGLLAYGLFTMAVARYSSLTRMD